MRRRYELHLGNDLRLRGVLGRTKTLARGQFGIELRDIPGQPPETALPRRGDEENAVVPHAERQLAGFAAHCGRPTREQPDTRRHQTARVHPEVYGLQYADEVIFHTKIKLKPGCNGRAFFWWQFSTCSISEHLVTSVNKIIVQGLF